MKRAPIFLLFLALGCAHETGVTLCSLPSVSSTPGATIDSLESDAFSRLLLGSDANACDGSAIETPSLPEGCVEPEAPLRAEPLESNARDLVIRPAGGAFSLAFLPLRRDASGLVEGPIAIVRYVENRLDVRALGTLRTYPSRLRLEIVRVDTSYVLVADGESCTEGTCHRATRLLLLEGQRFVSLPLTSSNGACLGAAWFPRSETRVARLGPHEERSFERTVDLAFETDRVVVNEHIVVQDADPADPSLPSRLFRRSSAEREIRVKRSPLALETTGESLFHAMLVDEASLSASESAARRASAR